MIDSKKFNVLSTCPKCKANCCSFYTCNCEFKFSIFIWSDSHILRFRINSNLIRFAFFQDRYTFEVETINYIPIIPKLNLEYSTLDEIHTAQMLIDYAEGLLLFS